MSKDIKPVLRTSTNKEYRVLNETSLRIQNKIDAIVETYGVANVDFSPPAFSGYHVIFLATIYK